MGPLSLLSPRALFGSFGPQGLSCLQGPWAVMSLLGFWGLFARRGLFGPRGLLGYLGLWGLLGFRTLFGSSTVEGVSAVSRVEKYIPIVCNKLDVHVTCVTSVCN